MDMRMTASTIAAGVVPRWPIRTYPGTTAPFLSDNARRFPSGVQLRHPLHTRHCVGMRAEYARLVVSSRLDVCDGSCGRSSLALALMTRPPGPASCGVGVFLVSRPVTWLMAIRYYASIWLVSCQEIEPVVWTADCGRVRGISIGFARWGE